MGQGRRDSDFMLGKVAIDGDVTVSDVTIGAALPAGDNNIGNVDLASAIPAGTNNIGDVDVLSVAPPSTVVFGRKTIATAGTEEALASSTTLTQGVTIRALTANTNLVFVGTNPVTSSTGYQLAAGESVFVACNNLATIFIDVTTNGEGVSYIGG